MERIILAVLLTCFAAIAQSQWALVPTTGTGPSSYPIGTHHMCYDESRDVVVAVRVFQTSAQANEVFELDPITGVWSNPQPAIRPTPLNTNKIALFYDPASQNVLLRGWDVSTIDQTWEWDGTSWSQWPNDSLGRCQSFVTDGQDTYLLSNDFFTGTTTNVFKRVGNAWSLVSSIAITTSGASCSGDRPLYAYYNSQFHSIEWSRSFFGVPGTEVRRYELGSSTWSLFSVQDGLVCHRSFDLNGTNRIVGFLGEGSGSAKSIVGIDGDYSNYAWHQDGSQNSSQFWNQDTDFDISDEHKAYALDGTDLYSIDANVALVEPYGSGCSGPDQAFQEYNDVGTGIGVAAPGKVSGIDLWSTNDPTVAGVLIGSQIAPPLDLTLFGAPGCFLSVNTNGAVNLPVVTTTSGPRARVTFSWPYSLSYLGLEFHSQSYAFDAGANQLGIVVSQPVKLTLGR